MDGSETSQSQLSPSTSTTTASHNVTKIVKAMEQESKRLRLGGDKSAGVTTQGSASGSSSTAVAASPPATVLERFYVMSWSFTTTIALQNHDENSDLFIAVEEKVKDLNERIFAGTSAQLSDVRRATLKNAFVPQAIQLNYYLSPIHLFRLFKEKKAFGNATEDVHENLVTFRNRCEDDSVKWIGYGMKKPELEKLLGVFTAFFDDDNFDFVTYLALLQLINRVIEKGVNPPSPLPKDLVSIIENDTRRTIREPSRIVLRTNGKTHGETVNSSGPKKVERKKQRQADLEKRIMSPSNRSTKTTTQTPPLTLRFPIGLFGNTSGTTTTTSVGSQSVSFALPTALPTGLVSVQDARAAWMRAASVAGSAAPPISTTSNAPVVVTTTTYTPLGFNAPPTYTPLGFNASADSTPIGSRSSHFGGPLHFSGHGKKPTGFNPYVAFPEYNALSTGGLDILATAAGTHEKLNNATTTTPSAHRTLPFPASSASRKKRQFPWVRDYFISKVYLNENNRLKDGTEMLKDPSVTYSLVEALAKYETLAKTDLGRVDAENVENALHRLRAFKKNMEEVFEEVLKQKGVADVDANVARLIGILRFYIHGYSNKTPFVRVYAKMGYWNRRDNRGSCVEFAQQMIEAENIGNTKV